MDKFSSSLVVLLLILTSLSLPASTRPHSRHKRHACESVLQCASAVGASIPIRQEICSSREIFQNTPKSSRCRYRTDLLSLLDRLFRPELAAEALSQEEALLRAQTALRAARREERLAVEREKRRRIRERIRELRNEEGTEEEFSKTF